MSYLYFAPREVYTPTLEGEGAQPVDRNCLGQDHFEKFNLSAFGRTDHSKGGSHSEGRDEAKRSAEYNSGYFSFFLGYYLPEIRKGCADPPPPTSSPPGTACSKAPLDRARAIDEDHPKALGGRECVCMKESNQGLQMDFLKQNDTLISHIFLQTPNRYRAVLLWACRHL